jgi:hypothetical protein
LRRLHVTRCSLCLPKQRKRRRRECRVLGGGVGRKRDCVVHLVPRQRDHALDEIHRPEHVTVGRGPSPEKPSCLADSVGGLVEATTTDENQGLAAKRDGCRPCKTDAFGEVEIIECAV